MRPICLALLGSVLAANTVVSGDALSLLQDEQATFDPFESDATTQTATGIRLRVELGANLLDNLDPQSALGEFEMHPGLDVGASVGYQFTEMFGVEGQVGFSWNRFKEWAQGTKPAIDATGDFFQVPMVVNLVVRVPLTTGNMEPIFGEDAELIFFAGGGGEYANGTLTAESQDIFSIDGWTFRYGAGAALNARLTDTVKFGLYFRFGRSGELDGTQPVGADLTFSALTNYAVGLNASFRF